MDRDKILASDVISPALWCTDQSGTVLTCRTKIPERTPAADVGFAVATVLAFESGITLVVKRATCSPIVVQRHPCEHWPAAERL
jgi:hypothetical protein